MEPLVSPGPLEPTAPSPGSAGRAIVDADVAAVLAGIGARATGAVRITGLPSSRSDHATFRVTLDDGRVVKTRRLSRAGKARRFVGLARGLASAQLAPILAHEGRICVEGWIDGVPLSALPPCGERLRAAADLLGALHATRRLQGRRVARRGAPARVLQRAERQLGRLAAAAVLTPARAAELARVLRSATPARAPIGLIHGDFCAENLVEDARGRLVAVDNESLRLDFLDFDLARTWARWPMPDPDWDAFLARYARWRGEPVDAAAAPFWRAAAIVKSLHLRTARRTALRDAPLRRLDELLAGLGAGAQPLARSRPRSSSTRSR